MMPDAIGASRGFELGPEAEQSDSHRNTPQPDPPACTASSERLRGLAAPLPRQISSPLH